MSKEKREIRLVIIIIEQFHMKVVDGHRVMELTGLSPGPQVGKIIKKATEWAIDNNYGTYYTLGISFQTHRGKFFVPAEYSRQHGENEYDFGRKFYASNGILLRSISYPEWKAPDTLYVRGKFINKDINTFIVSEMNANRIFEAVDEYNLTFGYSTFGYSDAFPILDDNLFIIK